MHRLFFLTTLFLINFNLISQSYIGFEGDNFNGVHGVLTNPGLIANAKTKLDINLFSVSEFTTNSYIELEYFNYMFKEYDDIDEIGYKIVGSDKFNYGVNNLDILGPSFQVNIDEKQSIAFTSRIRSITNVNNISGQIIDFFRTERLSQTEAFLENDVNASIIHNNWIEIGGTYSRVLSTSKIHYLKGGISLKYLMGYGSATAKIDNALLIYNRDNLTVSSTGAANYNYSANADLNQNHIPFEDDDDYEIKKAASGLGLDIGVVYEYRPNYRANISRTNPKDQVVIREKVNYKFKAGVSIMDLGAMTYKNSLDSSLDLNQTVNAEDLLSISNEEDLQSLYGFTAQLLNQKILLPTTVRTQFDWKHNDKIYFNFNTIISLYGKNNVRANRYTNQFTLTPRYETKWFTAFSPISITQFSGVQWGLGARLGPLFIGSSGAISHILIDRQTRAFDLYAGLKIPFYYNDAKVKCKECLDEDDPSLDERLKGYEGIIE